MITPTVTAALTNTSPMSEITLTIIADLDSDDCLLTKDAHIHSNEGSNVLEIHTPGEILYVSKDCILKSYSEGAWGLKVPNPTHALAATTGSGNHNFACQGPSNRSLGGWSHDQLPKNENCSPAL